MSADKLTFKESFGAQLLRGPSMSDKVEPKGVWMWEHWRAGEIIKKWPTKNMVLNAAKNSMLDVFFNGATAVAAASWFKGLISSASYTAINAADTMASHSGWTEFTGYSQSTRPLWTQGSAASQAITNASPVVFSITSSGTVKGGFIVSNSTKSGTSGLAWCATLFPSDTVVANLDELRTTYTLSL